MTAEPPVPEPITAAQRVATPLGKATQSFFATLKTPRFVTNTDLDGLLCAAYMTARHGWRFVGFANPCAVWLIDDEHLDDQLVFLESDVTHPRLRAIGQHVLPSAVDVAGHAFDLFSNHLNINEQVRIPDFTQKYPFALINFLMWHFGDSILNLPTELARVVVFADSARNNAHYPRFRDNARTWLSERMPDAHLRYFIEVACGDSTAYNDTMRVLFQSTFRYPTYLKNGRQTQPMALEDRTGLTSWLRSVRYLLDWLRRTTPWGITLPLHDTYHECIRLYRVPDTATSQLAVPPVPFSTALIYAASVNSSYVEEIGPDHRACDCAAKLDVVKQPDRIKRAMSCVDRYRPP